MMNTAQQIVAQLAQGDSAAVEQRLADNMKPFAATGTLQATWQGLEQQVGAFQEQGKTLGHSLGGNLAPRIGAADPGIRGLIILAGSARPLEDVILDQMTYVLSLSIPDAAVRQQQLTLLKKQVELVKDPNRLPTAVATDLPFNVPAAYWLDLNAETADALPPGRRGLPGHAR